MTFEELEAESVQRYAFQILEQMKKLEASKLILARALASLLESAIGFCGDELGAEFVRRMRRMRRLSRGFCTTCGKEKVTLPPLICSACDEQELS